MIILKIIYFATVAFAWVSFLHCCIYVRTTTERKYSLKLLKAVVLMFIVSFIPLLNISVGSVLFNDELCNNMIKKERK